MARFLILVFTVMATAALCAQESWKISEEVEVDGNKVQKVSYIGTDIMRTVNTAASGQNESIVDLKKDSITMVNHIQKTYQVFKLSEYIKFAQNMADSLKNQGYINPDKVEPKIAYIKKKAELLGKWNSQNYIVKVDGKDAYEIWVAPELKESPVIGFRKKFAAVLPEGLAKYRTIEEKVKDHFDAEGLIVKMIKIPINKKLPKITQTMTAFDKADITPEMLVIPSDYADKTVGTPAK